MVAPSFTGFTTISNNGVPDGWVSPASAVGVAPNDTTTVGAAATPEFGSNVRLRGRGAGTVLQTTEIPITLDLTQVEAVYGLIAALSDAALEPIANNGVVVGFSDAADNYWLWAVNGVNDLGSQLEAFIVKRGVTPTVDNGLDDENITKLIVGYTTSAGNANNFNPQILVDQVAVLNAPTLADGEVGDVASFDSLIDLLASTNVAALDRSDGAKDYKLQIPLTIDCEVFQSSGGALIFESGTTLNVGDSYYYLRFTRSTATATFELNNLKIISVVALQIETPAGSDATLPISLSTVQVEGPGTTTIRSPMRWAGCSETGRTLVRYISGEVTRSSLTNSNLQVDCTPGQDLSALGYFLDGTTQLLLNPDSAGPATINLSGLTTDTTVTINNLTANDITVAVAAGFNYVVAAPTAGGGSVTVVAPQPTMTFSDIPAGGIFTIWDDEDPDPQDLGSLLQTNNPTDGNSISYVGVAGNLVYLQFVPDTGASAAYKEFNIPFTIANQSQTQSLATSLEIEDNL